MGRDLRKIPDQREDQAQVQGVRLVVVIMGGTLEFEG